jgi:hypothetical protein
MKELITGDRVQINKKHVPEVECPNLANFIFISNSVTPLHVDPNDRRYFVVHCSEKKLPSDLKARVWKWVNDGGLAALLYELMHRDLSAFDPYAPPPMTPEKLEAIDLCRSETERFVADLQGGETLTPLMLGEEIRSRAELRGIKMSGTALGRALSSAGAPKRLIRINGEVVRVYAVRDYKKWAATSPAQWQEQLTKQATLPARRGLRAVV